MVASVHGQYNPNASDRIHLRDHRGHLSGASDTSNRRLRTHPDGRTRVDPAWEAPTGGPTVNRSLGVPPTRSGGFRVRVLKHNGRPVVAGRPVRFAPIVWEE